MTQPSTTRALIEALCSDECAGRRTATPGGIRARGLVVDALRDAGLDPFEQTAPKSGGANVIATLPGTVDRWVLVGAHYDHLGVLGGEVYRGASDNAASVAILVELGRALAKKRAEGRGVLLVAFDAEEPPFFSTDAMGSQHWVSEPTVPLEKIDMMVSMELLGHAIGPAGLPGAVRESVFALGAERSEGTGERLDALRDAESGVIVRRADADIIPPLSDHLAFWEAGVPFMLLTGTRSSTYHTPEDTAERLDLGRVAAVSRWLERFVRDQCARPEKRVRFLRGGRDDASTLDAMRDLLAPLVGSNELAAMAMQQVRELRGRCDRARRLSDSDREAAHGLVAAIEDALR